MLLISSLLIPIFSRVEYFLILFSMPCRMSHASIPEHVRKERQLPEDLIRLCVGIEDENDLLDDLKAALQIAGYDC